MTTNRRVRRIHAVLETTDESIYLGAKLTHHADPAAVVNLGHVHALLRASRDLIDMDGGVVVYLEGRPPRRWRLHRDAPGSDPVITDLPPSKVTPAHTARVCPAQPPHQLVSD